MNLKNISYIAVTALLLPFMGCKKDLTTSPTNAVSDELLYTTADNIETVLNGTWAYMHDTFFTYSNPGYSTILRTSDAMGDDVAIITNKYGYRDAYEFTLADNQTRLNAIWTILYKVIDNCNNVIAKIDASSGTDAKKAQVKGQALALRANSYLTLATFYQFNYQLNPQALAVPIYTEPTTDKTAAKGKSTLEEVYKLIISDLSTAEKLLPAYQRPSATKYKINIDVVHGLLARTYLNMGKWDLAAQEALEAKKSYNYMPTAEYGTGFNDLKNSEWIWGQGQQPDQSTASYTFHFLDVSSPSSYYYSFMADPNFKKLFDDGDIRSKLFFWDNLDGREGYLRYQKFKFRADQTGDIVMMRSAEMTLIAAEGYARSGNTTKAIELLNELRAARQAKIYTGSNDPKSVIDEILIERRKELWGEGFALSDILRTQTAVKRLPALDDNGQPLKVTIVKENGTKVVVSAKQHTTLTFSEGQPFTANSKYYLFRVPQTELNSNPNISN